MVLDSLSQKERQGVAGVFLAGVILSLIVGYGMGSMSDSGMTDQASIDEIESTAQSIVDQQTSSQQQQMAMMANQSENISQDDLSFEGEVTDVEESEFESLYSVTISITGDTVTQTGELESIDEEQTLYISNDGRYLFSEPTDLEAQQQQQGQQTPQAPSGQ